MGMTKKVNNKKCYIVPICTISRNGNAQTFNGIMSVTISTQKPGFWGLQSPRARLFFGPHAKLKTTVKKKKQAFVCTKLLPFFFFNSNVYQLSQIFLVFDCKKKNT